jgi:CRISPR-associated DxTHG motif protein
MIAISFLGTGDYKEVTYFDMELNKTFRSKYFTSVLANIYNPNTIYLVLTPEAKAKHADALNRECSFNPILVPFGKSTGEIWEMFSTITEAIPENEELIIDVTHGFRSQPMLALSMAFFLRTVKNIKIKKIIYGAYEAIENDLAPIFDITTLINILDWTSAVDNFIKFGNAKHLKIILAELQKKIKFEREKITSVKSFGNLMNDITQSLSFIRPQELSKFSKELPQKLNAVKNDIESIPEVKPLHFLLNKIPESFSNLVIEDQNIFTDAGFKMQANMIKYYLETEQYVQAITLSREVVVSLMCRRHNSTCLEKDTRENAEETLYHFSELLKKGMKLDDSNSAFGNLWQSLTSTRNDINHAGMRKSYGSASSLNGNVIKICNQVIEFILSQVN